MDQIDINKAVREKLVDLRLEQIGKEEFEDSIEHLLFSHGYMPEFSEFSAKALYLGEATNLAQVAAQYRLKNKVETVKVPQYSQETRETKHTTWLYCKDQLTLGW